MCGVGRREDTDITFHQEHHLQAALSSSQLATESANGAQPNGSKQSYHIPTPEAKSVLADKEYNALYPIGAYSDPFTYVRTSKTTEESIRGPSYILDEDDNDWLEERNAKALEALNEAIKSRASSFSSVKGKGKERAKEELATTLGQENVDLYIISMDEFEMVMTVFEKATSERVPFLHLDLSKMPSFEDLQTFFDDDSSLSELAMPELPQLPWEVHYKGHPCAVSEHGWSPDNPYRNLSALKSMAKIIYPWWKERREEQDGKQIIPGLNFDESNENDPYVCFRRREVKMVRKTRKTDALHLEKLIRLRHELAQSVTLVALVAQREKTKRASVAQDKICWDYARDFMSVKRQWNLSGSNNGQEDDELLSGEKREDTLHGVAGAASMMRKKRKVDEGQITNGVVKLPNRKQKPVVEESSSQATTTTTTTNTPATSNIGAAILRRVDDVQNYIERECQRKQENDVGWEEGTDTALQPMPVAPQLRAFRPIHVDSSSAAWSLSSPSSRVSRAGRPASYRRRMARGGRIFLDRKLPTPSPVPASLSDWPRHVSRPNVGSVADTANDEQRSSLSKDTSKEVGEQSQRTPSISQTATKSHRAHSQLQPLTGPFAFSASIRPSLLSSTPLSHISGGQLPSTGAVHNDGDGSASEVSSSTSSHSKESVDSTVATSIEDVEESKDTRNVDIADDDSDASYSTSSDDEEERWGRLQEQWRYDEQGGRWAGLGLCGLGGMEDDEEAVIDDFDQKFMRYRMKLLEDSDLIKLSTDLGNVLQAQAAADVPASQPMYAIFRGENPSMYQQQQAAQQQQQVALLQQQQQTAAAAAAAAQASSLNQNAATQRAGNMGTPSLSSLQSQQNAQAQIQLALQQQQQQRAVQAQSLAAAAVAAAASNGQQSGSPNANGSASPISRPRSQQQAQQPHPLSQSFGASNAGVASSPSQLPGARYPQQNGNAQVAMSPFTGMSGSMSSPQLSAHVNHPPSSSPVPQQRSSPAQNGSYHSSPAQNHAMPAQSQGGQQQQQRISPVNFGNLLAAANGNGQVPGLNPLAAAAAFQQAQAALQAQQTAPQQQQQQQMSSHQALLAIQNALANNSNLQLKMPQNRQRALQLAQQAAKNAGMTQPQIAPQVGQQTPQQQSSPLSLSMLQSLQQQLNFTQQNTQSPTQQPNLSSMGVNANSLPPNAQSILAALNNTGHSPQSKS